MGSWFEKLDYCQTPIGEVSLHPRREVSLDVNVFEHDWAEDITFYNSLPNPPFTQTVYLARTAETSNEAE